MTRTRSLFLVLVLVVELSSSLAFERVWAQVPFGDPSQSGVDSRTRSPESYTRVDQSSQPGPFEVRRRLDSTSSTKRPAESLGSQSLKLNQRVRSEDAKSPNDVAGGGIESFAITIGSLLLVICLIVVIAKVLKKHVPFRMSGIPSEALEVLGKQHLDQRQSIYLVRCGSRILILGSSNDRLNSLAEVSDPIEVDYLSGLCRHADDDIGVIQTFRELLNNHRPGRRDTRQSDAQDVTSTLNRNARIRSEPVVSYQGERVTEDIHA